jgi:hypothetical protein
MGLTRDSTVSGLLENNTLAWVQFQIGLRFLLSQIPYDGPVPQPSIEEKGMTTMRLHRLHFSSSPWSQTLAINCPHSQRVSEERQGSSEGAFAMAISSC